MMKPTHVLVVEDDAFQSLSVEIALRSAGHEVLTAGGARVAAELLQNDVLPDIDLLVIDLGLPDARGEDLIRFVRMHPRFASLPIVIATAKTALSPAVRHAAAAVFNKPYDVEALQAEVDRLLRTRAARP